MGKKRRKKKDNTPILDLGKAIVGSIVNGMAEHAAKRPETRQFMRDMGLLAGIFSKGLLEGAGCQVDFKINGEHIDFIANLDEFGIRERIKLAIEEERYEDAANLKKLLPVQDKKVLYLEATPLKEEDANRNNHH